jgi:multiple sugar transport system substrate-binding protein
VPATPSTLVVACFYPVDQTAGWKGLVADFEEKHPGVKVTTQVSPWAEYLPKLLTQLAAGTPPDVLGVENTPFIQFVRKEVVADLTPWLDKDPVFKPEDFFPKLIDRYTIDGRVFGIPYDVQPMCSLFYNKGLFEEANVGYPAREWRWDNLLDAALKLTKEEGGRVTQYGFHTAESMVDRQFFVFSNGGAVVDDVKNPTRATFDNPKTVEGVRYWADLINKHKVSPQPAFFVGAGAGAGDLFATGRLAMFLGGYWEFVFAPDKFKQVNLGLQLGPAGPDGTRGYATGGTAYCVATGTKQEAVAWEFVKFFMGMPGYEAAFKEAQYGVIYPPAYIPAYESYVFAKHPNPPIENMTINGDAAEYAHFTPHHPKWVEIRDIIILPISTLIANGEKDPEEGLAEMQTQVQGALSGS